MDGCHMLLSRGNIPRMYNVRRTFRLPFCWPPEVRDDEKINNNMACDDGSDLRVITMAIFADAHSDVMLLWSVSRDFMMDDKQSQWIGRCIQQGGDFFQSMENARQALTNPCGHHDE